LRIPLIGVVFGASIAVLGALVSQRGRPGALNIPALLRAATIGAAIGLILAYVDLLLTTGYMIEQFSEPLLVFAGIVGIGAAAIAVANTLLRATTLVRVPDAAITADLVLGIALASLLVSLFGVMSSLAIVPAVELINRGGTAVVVISDVAANAAAVLLAIALLRWTLSGRHADRWRRRGRLLSTALFVCAVFLIDVFLTNVARHVFLLFSGPVYNVTQIDLTASVPGRIVLHTLLPIVGIIVVLLMAPRFTSTD
jgi:hypothetical protein